MVFRLLFLLIPCLLYGVALEEPWGKDCDLLVAPSEVTLPPRAGPLPFLSEKIIQFHQTVISPVDGPRSHFRPTSSQYMRLAIRRYGFLQGYIMGCDRLLRENSDPWVYRHKTINGVLYKWDPTTR